MDTLLDEPQLEGVYAYQDDIIFGSNSFEENVSKLNKIFCILIKYNLTLSPSNCTFHKRGVNYWRFHIEDHCITPVQTNVIKINSFPVPKTKRQVKKFTSLITLFCFFLKNI